MYNRLDQILPSEIAMMVLTYSRHPVADIMALQCTRHEKKMRKWRAWCKKEQVDGGWDYEGFAFHYFMEQHTKKGQKVGKTPEQVCDENPTLRELYREA